MTISLTSRSFLERKPLRQQRSPPSEPLRQPSTSVACGRPNRAYKKASWRRRFIGRPRCRFQAENEDFCQHGRAPLTVYFCFGIGTCDATARRERNQRTPHLHGRESRRREISGAGLRRGGRSMRTHGSYWKGNHPHEARRSGHPVEARGRDGGVRQELAAAVAHQSPLRNSVQHRNRVIFILHSALRPA